MFAFQRYVPFGKDYTMKRRWMLAVLCMATFSGVSVMVDATEILYSENFDGQGMKPGQSIVASPLDWKWIGPSDPAKNRVGNVSLDVGKHGLTGNYLEGSTATIPDAENYFQKTFPIVTSGKVTLFCRAYAAGKTSVGSSIWLRPSYYTDRGSGWVSTVKGWEFWTAFVHSKPCPLDGQKPVPCRIEKESIAGGHDLPVELCITVDLDHNKTWGQARWKDAQGIARKFKTASFPWDSAGGDVANIGLGFDKRNGHTGISVDDLRVEGNVSVPHPHPFEQNKHNVLRLDGEKGPVLLPAEAQWISKSWNGENAVLPYLVYMPEKDRILMLFGYRKSPVRSALISSNDRGKTWSQPRWLNVEKDGRPNGGAIGLTYLGHGKLLAFPEELNVLWISSDYGQTWEVREPISPSGGMFAWNPLLIVRDTNRNIDCVAQGCWKPTGVPAWSDKGTYSQGYFRSSSDEALTWSDPVKIPQWLGVNEISIIIAHNGDWVAACRTDCPKRYVHYDLDHYNGLGISVSKDQGKTWSDVKSLYEWGRHHPSMVLLPDGRILMTYVVRLGYPNTADGFPRFGVEAVISRDNGWTWDLEHRYILAQWTGNIKGRDFFASSVQCSSTVLLPDGMLLTGFGAGFCNKPGNVWKMAKMDLIVLRWRTDAQTPDNAKAWK